MELKFRIATAADEDSIWAILEPIIREGKSYVFAPDSSREKMLAFWMDAEKHTYLAELDGMPVGTFFLKTNQPDRGSHVVNAGYMVAPHASGRGIGRAMAIYSFQESKRLGYQAMQFNYVLKTNTSAVKLWKKLGFEIVGEIPDAFIDAALGPTNVYVMYRAL